MYLENIIINNYIFRLSLKTTLSCIFILASVNTIYAKSTLSEIDDYYSQQIQNQIWQIERRIQKNPSIDIELELLPLRIKKLEYQLLAEDDKGKYELIKLLSALKNDYRKNLDIKIQYLKKSMQTEADNISTIEEIKHLENEIPDTNILCINQKISYSSGIFGHKEHDTFSCGGLLLTNHEFSMDKSGVFGSNAKISEITDTEITVFRWTNAFSDVKYQIKIWVNDIKTGE